MIQEITAAAIGYKGSKTTRYEMKTHMDTAMTAHMGPMTAKAVHFSRRNADVHAVAKMTTTVSSTVSHSHFV